MRAFAEWVSSRRHRSVLTAAVLGLLSPLIGMLAPLAVPSAGVVVLADLRHGAREALLVLVAATLLLMLAWKALGFGAGVALVISVGLWLPALGVTELLRRTGSLSLCLQASVLVVSALAIVMFATGDPVSKIQAVLDAVHTELDRAFPTPLDPETMANLARTLTAVGFGGTLVALASSVLLGRWWESLVSGSGGFAAEFRALRMGQLLAVACVLVLAGGLLTHTVLLQSLLYILGAGFMFQGLAVLHTAAAVQGLQVGWMIGLYVALFVTALYAGFVIAVLGWFDTWFDLRGRLLRRQAQR